MRKVMLGKLRSGNDTLQWQTSKWNQISSLKEIAEALEENEGEGFSIPSIYEAAICFQKALLNFEENRKGGLPNEVIKWRCLLAVLALQGIKNYPVSFEREDFKGCSGPFLKALEMRPKERLLTAPVEEDWSWLPFYIVKYEGVDIALFSPATILYPVAKLEEKLKACRSFPWYDRERSCLMEPQTGMADEEKRTVYAWLERLRKRLADMLELNGKNGCRVNRELLQAVEKQVTEFQDALEIPDTEKNNIDFCFEEIVDARSCFRSSSLEFSAAEFLNITIKPVIKIGDFHIPYNDILGNRLFYTPCEKNPFEGCLEAAHYEIRNYGEAGQKQGKAFALLPFSREFMEILSKCEERILHSVLEGVSLHFQREISDNEEKYYISVKTDLTALDSCNLSVSRKYGLEGDCIELSEKENLTFCIWPRVAFPDWKVYYSYIYYEGAGGGDEKFQLVLPDTGEKPIIGKYCIRTRDYPRTAGFQRGGEFLGVLCPKKENCLKPKEQRQAVVAVDFGTTGTRVRAQVGEEKEEIHLDEEHIAMVVNKTSEERLRNKAMWSEFLPVKEEDAAGKYFDAFLMQLCMQTTVYLVKKYGVSEIAWRYAVPSGESEQRDKICQIWQYVCERLTDITGLTHKSGGQGIEILKSYAVSFYFIHVGSVNYSQGFYSVDIGSSTTDIALWQEMKQQIEDGKLTMCRQFSLRMAGRKMLTEAVWDYAEQFLTLCNDESFLKPWFQDIVNRKSGGSRHPRDEENAAVDRLIAVHGESIREMLYNGSGQNDYWVNKLRARLAMNIAMLMYCLGRMMGESIFNKEYVPRDRATPFKICIGGNGSCILDWVGTGDWDGMADDMKKPYINVFRMARAYEIFWLKKQQQKRNAEDIFEQGAPKPFNRDECEEIERQYKLTGCIEIFKSKEPKKEIAEGLLMLNEETIRRMEAKMEEKTEIEESAAKVSDIGWVSAYTVRFLEIFKEQFSGLRYYEELVNEDEKHKSGMIWHQDQDAVRIRIEQLYQGTGSAGDASASRNIYECMFEHILPDFLIEDIRQ